jgi:rubredoxin
MATRKELGLKARQKCKWVFSRFEVESRNGFIGEKSVDLGVDGTVYLPDQEPMPMFLSLTKSETREYFALLERIRKRIQSCTWEYEPDEPKPVRWIGPDDEIIDP